MKADDQALLRDAMKASNNWQRKEEFDRIYWPMSNGSWRAINRMDAKAVTPNTERARNMLLSIMILFQLSCVDSLVHSESTTINRGAAEEPTSVAPVATVTLDTSPVDVCELDPATDMIETIVTERPVWVLIGSTAYTEPTYKDTQDAGYVPPGSTLEVCNGVRQILLQAKINRDLKGE